MTWLAGGWALTKSAYWVLDTVARVGLVIAFVLRWREGRHA